MPHSLFPRRGEDPCTAVNLVVRWWVLTYCPRHPSIGFLFPSARLLFPRGLRSHWNQPFYHALLGPLGGGGGATIGIAAVAVRSWSFALSERGAGSPVEEDADELLAAHAPLALDVELLDHAVDLVLGDVLVELLDDGAQVVDGDDALGALVEEHEGLEQLLARVAGGDVAGGDALEALAREAQVHDAGRAGGQRLAGHRGQRRPVGLRVGGRLEGGDQVRARQVAEAEGLERVAELGEVELVVLVHVEELELHETEGGKVLKSVRCSFISLLSFSFFFFTYTVVDLASMLVAYLIPRLGGLRIPHGGGEARARARWSGARRRAVHARPAILVDAAAGIVVHPRRHHVCLCAAKGSSAEPPLSFGVFPRS